MIFNVPGKTYLVGEYAVLVGGAALGLATSPFFKIDYGSIKKTQLHSESPAAKLLKAQGREIDFSIENPYVGGFGYSAAEYWAAAIPDILKNRPHFSDLLKEYKKNHSGSGVDLAFQYFGRVCLADPAVQFYQNFSWHFENLDFAAISTGVKVPTHEHLNNLELTVLKDLPAQSEKVIQAFSRNREFEFLAELRKWADQLQNLGLTTDKSITLRAELEKFSAIKLAKPCGALGADVILVFFAKSQKESVREFLESQQQRIVAFSDNLCAGLQSQLNNSGENHVG